MMQLLPIYVIASKDAADFQRAIKTSMSLIDACHTTRLQASLPVYDYVIYGAGEGVPPFKPC